jgi:hypothetical protein
MALLSRIDPGERAKWAVVVPCAALVVLNLALRSYSGKIGEGLDAITLGLAAIGLSPWIAKIIESFKFGGLEFKFVRQLEKQDADIDSLKLLVLGFVSQHELDHLKKFASAQEFIVDKNNFAEDFRRDLRHLRDLGLINHYSNKGIRALYESPEQHPNVLEHFHITDAGREYLRMREEMAQDKTSN